MTDLAIDIGGTYIKYALVDCAYQIKRHWKIATRQASNFPLYDHIVCNIPSDASYEGIAVSVPGILMPDSTVRSRASSALAELYGTNIRQELSRRTGHPVSAINDGNAAALFEACFGAARDVQSSITVVIGTGIGGGLCHRGILVEGDTFAAGEFHMLPWPGPDGKRHKLGDLCKIGALQQDYFRAVGQSLPAEEILARSTGGDFAAVQAVDRWMYHLTTLLITLTAVYDPSIFCIGGAISKSQLFITELSRCYESDGHAYFPALTYASARVVPCSNYNESNLLGAVVKSRLGIRAGDQTAGYPSFSSTFRNGV